VINAQRSAGNEAFDSGLSSYIKHRFFAMLAPVKSIASLNPRFAV
jgi:hypothetical protein